MAQIITQPWNPPKFTFYTDRHASSWKKYYKEVIQFLTALNINPEEKDQNRTGWKRIKLMIKGDDRQILQKYIDNNTITQEDQRIPTQALKAIKATIEHEEHKNSTLSRPSEHNKTNNNYFKTSKTDRSTSQCPWKKFFTDALYYMDNLHAEPCQPQAKIAKFIEAAKHHFASPTTIHQVSKTSNCTDDTDSAYSEPTSPIASDTEPVNSPILQPKNTTHLPRPFGKNTTRDSQTPENTQTNVKQLTSPAPKPPAAPPQPKQTRKTPLLPTPTAPVQQNRSKSFITRPPRQNNRYNEHLTFARPPQFQHQQFITRPYPQQPALLPDPPFHHIPAFTGPPTHPYYRPHQIPHIPGPYAQNQQNVIQRPHYNTPQVSTIVINLLH